MTTAEIRAKATAGAVNHINHKMPSGRRAFSLNKYLVNSQTT